MQTHLIQIISSLVETPRPEMGLSDKREMAKCAVLGNHWSLSRELRTASSSLGVTMENAISMTSEEYIKKPPHAGRRQPMTSLPARPQYKGVPRKYKSGQVELYCHSATCGYIKWNKMLYLTGQ